MGKGSARRPSAVSESYRRAAWERTFSGNEAAMQFVHQLDIPKKGAAVLYSQGKCEKCGCSASKQNEVVRNLTPAQQQELEKDNESTLQRYHICQS